MFSVCISDSRYGSNYFVHYKLLTILKSHIQQCLPWLQGTERERSKRRCRRSTSSRPGRRVRSIRVAVDRSPEAFCWTTSETQRFLRFRHLVKPEEMITFYSINFLSEFRATDAVFLHQVKTIFNKQVFPF